MTTKIICEFIGGPKDGQIEEVLLERCPEKLELKVDGWIAAFQGRLHRFTEHEPIPEPKPANWHSFVRSIYLRVHEVRPKVTYWHMRDELVERCRAVMAGNERCMREAEFGRIGCACHPRGSVVAYRMASGDRRKRPRIGYEDLRG